jgi:sugar lactone lactonase YvrE
VVQGTPSSGVFTVAFQDAQHGILGAGELAAPTAFADTVARSQDGGKSWQLTTRPPFPGAVYGLSYAVTHQRHRDDTAANANSNDEGRRESDRLVVITGPNGAAWTPDEGDTWFSLSGVTNYWAVAFANPESGWLVGTEGRILKISFDQ